MSITHHIVINHDVLLTGLHLVVVGVADDDGERGCARHGGIPRVLTEQRIRHLPRLPGFCISLL